MMVSAEEKRWIVVGIAMQVAAPVLRNCIKQGMDKHYTNLDAYCSHLTAPCTLKTLTHHQVNADPTTLKNLKFQNVNNNHVHGKNRSLYTYNINSSVDLAKLYLPYYLAQFSAFDDSLDMTAILRLLGFNNYMPAAMFSLLTQASADDVRENVRNKWGHFNVSEWSEAFFNNCFDKVETLVRSLGLTAGVEKSTLDQLNDWKTKGCQLCMGHAVDQNLLSLVQQNVKELIKKYKKAETEQTAIQASLAKLGKEQIEMQTTVGTLQDQQSSTLEAVQQWQEQQKKENEKTLERLVSVERTLSEELLTRVKGVEEDLAGVKEDLAEVKTRVEHMEDNDRSDLLFRELGQRIVNTDDKVKQLSQEVKRLGMEDVKPGLLSPEQGACRSNDPGAGSRASDSSKQVHHNQEAHPVKSFDVKTCRSKLAEHYKRTAKVPTSVWSSVCQVELDQIYTRLSWVKKEQTPAGPSQSKLTHYSDLFSANKNGVVPKRILVQGQTGIGKSTFVKKLAVDWAELNALSRFELVLAVTLKELSSCQTLEEVISRSRLFPEDEEISTDDLLSYVRNNQEKILLVFDAYDEYRTGSEAEAKFGSRSNSPIFEIFHGNYLRGCTVLVTSRSSRADELQGSADKHAEITGFDEEDREAFMRKMIDNESEVDQLLEFLGEEDMEDVARVPLLNLFFCLLWRLGKEKFMELVKRKTKLYRALIRHILQYGHKKHFPGQVPNVKEENYDEILDEIGKVALESLLKGNQVFEYGRLSEKVRGEQSFIVGLLQLSEYGASLEPKEMVSFIHKSIQEYLAAWYITNKCVSDDNLGEIEEHARTLEDCEALENVFLFICGLSNKGAVKVFQHLSTVRVSDPSLDLSKIIPDKESETYVPRCGVTERHERFNYLVLNCVREVSSEAELVKHWFNCTGGIVYLTRPLGPELLPKPERLIKAEHSWGFYFPHFDYNRSNAQVSSLYKSVQFLNLFHIPLRIIESSEVLKLEDFLTKFLNIECGKKCLFSSVLCCRDGQIQVYITSLVLMCDAHVRVFTEAAVNQSLSAISLQSQPLSANMCSNQSCLKFLTSLNCGKRHNGELMKGLGAMIRNCKFLQRIILSSSSSSDYACGVLEQVANPGACNLLISDYRFGTSFEAEKFAALLPRFPNISTLNLHLGGCCAEAVTKLVTSITHNTLEKLSLREISFTSEAAAALGRALPEMTSLGLLDLIGKEGSILHAEEIEALFGRFNKELCLETLGFKRFHVRGNLAPLTKSFRFFPKLTWLSLEELDMDGVGLCLLLDSFQFISNMRVLRLTGNPLGHAVTYIVPHLINLPELNLLFIGNTGCSEEDKNYLREAAKAVRVRVMFL